MARVASSVQIPASVCSQRHDIDSTFFQLPRCLASSAVPTAPVRDQGHTPHARIAVRNNSILIILFRCSRTPQSNLFSLNNTEEGPKVQKRLGYMLRHLSARKVVRLALLIAFSTKILGSSRPGNTCMLAFSSPGSMYTTKISNQKFEGYDDRKSTTKHPYTYFEHQKA